jgi:hypothetical protein
LNNCVLIQNKKSLCRIVLQKDTLKASKEAIHELQTGVAKATGVRISLDYSVLNVVSLEYSRRTLVSIRFNIISQKEKMFGKDGFRIRVEKAKVYFEAETKSGLLNAVYTFLRQYCGFLWLWPGNDGEVYDGIDTLSIPVGKNQETPDYLWRHLLFTDIDEETGPEKWCDLEIHLYPNQSTMQQYLLWCKRNRMGGLKVKAGHIWGEWINPDVYGKSHPEYFAEIKASNHESITMWDGKHSGQLCTSNPEVVDIIIEKTRQFFDKNPDYDVVSISPNDGIGFCECNDCISADVSFGNPLPDLPHDALELDSAFKDELDKTRQSNRITGPITDRMFTFANKVAEQIEKSHPDKLLLILVYGIYRQPPKKVKLAPNVIAQYCAQCNQYWNAGVFEEDCQNLERLSSSSENMGIYEYYDQGAWPGVIRSFPDLIHRSVSYFHETGGRYYSTQAGTGFATNGFNLWFLAEMLWKSSTNVDKSINLYCKKAFGEAAGEMKVYFKLWSNRWQEYMSSNLEKEEACVLKSSNTQVAPFELVSRIYSDELLDKASQSLEQACAKVPVTSIQRRRIDFVARGLEATKIAIQAAQVSYVLSEKGWPMRYEEVTQESVRQLGEPAKVRLEVEKALVLWERWEAYMESVRDEFVLSHFWARYCFDSRKFLHPHFALKTILDVVTKISTQKNCDIA